MSILKSEPIFDGYIVWLGYYSAITNKGTVELRQKSGKLKFQQVKKKSFYA